MRFLPKGPGPLILFVLLCFFLFLIFSKATLDSMKQGVASSTTKAGSLLISDQNEKAPIAIVEVSGVILDSKKILEALFKAEKDEKVKAIIIRIDSPGGAVGPTQEIYEEIRRIDLTKPVYASFGSISASGGYYIGAATRKIFANAGTLTGSIGVIMQFLDASKLLEFIKLNKTTLKSGKFKDIGDASRPMTEEERKLMNELTQRVHEQFKRDIKAVRGKKIKGNIDEYAQGQVFSGEDALKYGLIDEIAGLWEAGRRIHKELNISEEFDMKVVRPKKESRLSELFYNLDESISNISTKIQKYHQNLLLIYSE